MGEFPVLANRWEIDQDRTVRQNLNSDDTAEGVSPILNPVSFASLIPERWLANRTNVIPSGAR